MSQNDNTTWNVCVRERERERERNVPCMYESSREGERER
jgi:hypothetical protein